MAHYDDIAASYLTYKSNNDFCENVEYHTFVHRLLLPALGIEDATKIDLKMILMGYRVLDLACGGGYLTRKLGEEFGCKDIVGVDISANMIATARAREEANPLGIVYHVLDVLNLVKPEKKFDIVVAFYLLNYAKTIDELDRMVQIISDQLNDSNNAHFLTITLNVCNSENIISSNRYPNYRCEAELPLVDGAQIKNTQINSDGSSFSYTTYYFSRTIYEEAFRKAGFKHFEWVSAIVACDGDNYEEFLKFPDVIGILAHK